jgi:phosphoenolpyruvate phosphomutase
VHRGQAVPEDEQPVAAGFRVAIGANHLVRSALAAMQRTARKVFEAESRLGIQDEIAPVEEIFRLQDEAELAEAEERYLPAELGRATTLPPALPAPRRLQIAR